MSSNVFLRVFGLKGISANMLNRYPKGKVWCSAELGSHKLETVKNGIGGGAMVCFAAVQRLQSSGCR